MSGLIKGQRVEVISGPYVGLAGVTDEDDSGIWVVFDGEGDDGDEPLSTGPFRPSELAAQPIEDYLATLPTRDEDGLFTAGITDQEQPMVSVTRPTHDWSETVMELEWATKPDQTPADKADAERLMLEIESQMPESYWENEGQATVELSQSDLDRLQQLVGTL